MSRGPDTLQRGRMSQAEVERLVHLATTMSEPTPGKIATKLNRHAATVAWQMIRRGLIRRPVSYPKHRTFVRNGRVCHRFDAAEDARLSELRAAGLAFRGIAQKLNAEFGRNRNRHSVSVRLEMLAAYEGASP